MLYLTFSFQDTGGTQILAQVAAWMFPSERIHILRDENADRIGGISDRSSL